jgi:hypothetical protein
MYRERQAWTRGPRHADSRITDRASDGQSLMHTRGFEQAAILGAAACLVGGSFFVAGCSGSSSRGASTKTMRARAATAESPGDSKSVAGSTQLHAGERAPLLRIHNVGRLLARCDRDGLPSVAFTSAFLLPTASVTVNTGRSVIRRILNPRQQLIAPTGSGVQTWQIAPFAEANVSITTVWISLGKSPTRAQSVPCGFSAQALTTVQVP